MRRRNFLKASTAMAARPAAFLSAASISALVTTESELYAAIASGATRLFVRGTIVLTRPLVCTGLNFIGI